MMVTRIQRSRTSLHGRSSRLAVAVLLAAAMVVSSWILSSNAERTVLATHPADSTEGGLTIRVSVPQAPVPAGTRVMDIALSEVTYPIDQLPEGAISDLSPYGTSTTLVALPAKLPIFLENLSKVGYGSNAVIERIPPGFRAMTMPVDTTSAVEGWARAGSIVDVLLVEKDRTSVVAEQVKVLSLERSVETGTSEDTATPTTVTLLVDQDQCLSINTAMPLGRIAFALRGMNDASKWARASFSAERLQAKSRTTGTAGVNGFVEIKGSNERYALSEGKWVKSERIPQGFLATQDGAAPSPINLGVTP